ncbi:hypothetical protein [Carboxylicivirga sp. N1Y90]|uniref:hypothetical protein n=1 Tax=Carboxylicivirga fragile TaxID=3417571 RepID=UPI003D33C9EC|nr:hypothetical protein [Marinilabiliaceae bacterium N1Y90]
MKILTSIILVAALTLAFSSCSKDDDPEEVLDMKGTFSISIDGTKYEGTQVLNGAVAQVRTISAENESFVFTAIMTDGLFKAGKTFDFEVDKSEIAPTIVVDLDGDGTDESLWGLTGTIKVVSTSEIEIDGVFYKDFLRTNPPHTVKGTVKSN